MEEKYLKNSIISFILIVSFVFMPLSFIPRKAQATNITGYISGLSGVITQLPLCKDVITSGVSSLFGGGVSKLTKSLQTTTSLDKIVGTASTTVEAVKVDIGKTVTDALTQGAASQKKTSEDTTALKSNDNCLKSIGRAVIKMLLQKITTDTVSWINGGMDGSGPLFVQNPGEYFKDIAKNEILQFNSEISDPKLFPFGKSFIKAQADSFKNKFSDNAQYSLDKMIKDTNPQYNAQTFSQDFSQGGWSAWDAMTQNAANNPLGFSLMASNELAKRVEEKTKLAEGSLQQSGGYLGVQKCVDPEGVTKEENDAALKELASNPTGPTRNRYCNRWNFVTPGQMVAAAATKSISYPDNNLLQAQDLNDAVAAILDALLGSFSSSFMSSDGFAGLTDTSEFQAGEGGVFVINTENTTTDSDLQTASDFSEFQIGASSFLAQNPNFNIRTDLNQALIDEQRIFTDKIKEQNKELLSSDPSIKPTKENGYYTGYYGLIPVTSQLDYCIPGPHPGWKEDSRTVLEAATSTLQSMSTEEIDKRYDNISAITSAIKTTVSLALAVVGLAIGAVVGSIIPGVGTVVVGAVLAVVGYLLGYVIEWLASLFSTGAYDPLTKTRAFYATQLESLTGIKADFNDEDAVSSKSLYSKESIVNIINVLLDRYAQRVDEVFNASVMPSVTKEASIKFLKLKAYGQIFKNNEDGIIAMKGIVERLTEIKDNIDTLNQELQEKNIKDKDGNISPAQDIIDPTTGNITTFGQENQYRENLKPWISAFGRISQEMVTGDDIARVDNTTKQVIDEKDYIYSDLLKGPNGCERALEDGKPSWFKWQIYDTKRSVYPMPILYDYNKFGLGERLPDPFNSGYQNQMISQANHLAIAGSDNFQTKGPGFLSYVQFQNNDYWFGEQCPNNIPIVRNSSVPGKTDPPNYDDNPKRNTPGVPYGTPSNAWDALACRIQTDGLFPLRDWPAFAGYMDGQTSGIFESMIGVW